MRRRLIYIPLLLVAFLAACLSRPQEGTGEAVKPTVTPASAAEAITPAAPVTPAPGTAVITNTTTVSDITVWVPPEIISRSEDGAALLLDQLNLAAAGYPDFQLRLEQKAVSGQGGILNYLRAGRTVAPTILPDLIIVRTDQLATAWAEGLIVSVGDLLDPSLVDDLFPVARDLAEVQGNLAGFPFALTDMTHLVYSDQVVTTTVPLTWEEMRGIGNQNLAFPAAGRAGAILGLQLYIDAGGIFINEAGQPELQQPALVSALTQLEQARQQGLIISQSSSISTFTESWQLWQNGAAVLAHTNAAQYLTSGFEAPALAAAPIPGTKNRLAPLVSGWAWAVTTGDPVKQAVVADIITYMNADANLAEWSLQNRLLPARRSSLEFWPQDNSYVRFIESELLLAEPFPTEVSSAIVAVIGNAVFDIVSLTKTPEQAADEVLFTLRQ